MARLFSRIVSTTTRRQRGSMSLTALISVSGGVLFAMLFTNLVRYVAVENALEQAAQKVARCIDPTDPVCVAYSAVPGSIDKDWFQTASRSEVQSSWVDRYNYAAAFTEQHWEASGPAFEIHRVVAPPVAWTEWLVQQKTFTPDLNAFERLSLVIDSDVTTSGFFQPLNNPNFPDMDADYELSVRDHGIDAWSWIRLNGSAPRGSRAEPIALASARSTTLPTQRLRFAPGADLDKYKVVEFVSPYFPVPALETPGEDLPCVAPGLCGAATPAGAAQADFRKFAFIAVKTFSTVTALNPAQDPKVRWANIPSGSGPSAQGAWGLQIETLPGTQYAPWKAAVDIAAANGSPLPPEPAPVFECLGGRDGSSAGDVTHGSGRSKSLARNYDLRLRGPLERDPRTNLPLADGRDPACPNNDIQHWALKVERGGAYRFHAFMMVKGGDVDVSVTFKHYFDNYTKVPAGTQHCHREQAGTKADQVPDAQCPRCDPKAASETNLTCALQPVPVLSNDQQLLSDPSVSTAPAAPACSQSVSAVYCAGEVPSLDSQCAAYLAANPQRKLLGWKSEVIRDISVATVPSGCSATRQIQSASCGDGRSEVTFRGDGNYGDPNSCPAARQTADTLRANAETVNTSQPADAPRFAATGPESFTWGTAEEFSPPRWQVAVSPNDEAGTPITDPESIRRTTLARENILPIYKHTDSGWHPTNESFGLPVGFQSSISLKNEIARTIDSVYPFVAKPEFEIPDFLPTAEARASCSGAPEPIEDRLRAYSALAVPQLADPAIALSTSADYSDTIQTGMITTCKDVRGFSTPLPACTKLSHTAIELAACGQDIYLGRYPSGEYPNGPALCAETGACRSEVATDKIDDAAPEQTVNYALAKNIGYLEIERALPGLKRDCDSPGCAAVTIDSGTSGRTMVSLAYHMPLTFPLDAIYGSSQVVIEQNKSEVRELAGLGRFRNTSADKQ